MIYQNGIEVYEQWEKIPVLNDGFICLSDHMGNDAKIASRARTSYGNDTRFDDGEIYREALSEHFKTEVTSYENTDTYIIIRFKDELKQNLALNYWTDKKQVEALPSINLNEEIQKKDCSLIRRLLRHGHTSPFEFCEVEFLVRVPMDCWRQWVRHRTANINEYSTRYSDAIDSQQKTAESEWRLQATDNKQGSSGFLEWWPDGTKHINSANSPYLKTANTPDGNEIDYLPIDAPGKHLTIAERNFHEAARALYQDRLSIGIAKEQARKDLPLSTYTEAYWKCDLHNIFNFLRLRMDPHAQQEIRLYATAVASIVKGLFPIAYEAFEDYQLNAMKLTALDIRVIQEFNNSANTYEDLIDITFNNKTERLECVSKLKKLGFM